MLTLPLTGSPTPIRRVLALGCHADDIEIGCGGTLLTLMRALPELRVTWVVLAASGPRAAEADASARAFLAGAGEADVRILDFRDRFLPYEGGLVKEAVALLVDVEPDLVFTHTRDDLHQDHRFACELTWNTFRDHLILEYEIPKYDGDRGAPNVFVPLLDELVDTKVQLVLEHFPSQAGKHWFDEELLRGILRLRGMECGSRYAEGFLCRKLSLA
jgi:LmbE family N-acetylglucosaminyl deacetylase